MKENKIHDKYIYKIQVTIEYMYGDGKTNNS